MNRPIISDKSKIFWQFFFVTFFVDQTSKFLVTLLNFSVEYNAGISFNVVLTANSKLLTLGLFFLVLFLFFSFQEFWMRNQLAGALFFGGAVSNIFDRIFFASVRDWLTIPFTHIQNNLADWAIFFGLFLLINTMFISTNKK